MSVLVHVRRRGRRKSFVLAFKEGTSAEEIKMILRESRGEAAIRRLVARSVSSLEIPERERKRAAHLAHFTVSDRYTAEKLG